MKKHLSRLPILVKPKAGKKFWVYLSATKHAVSSILVWEEKANQKHVYYVNHALRGSELRSIEVEKVALTMVITERKMRPYYMSYPIRLLTNNSFKRIMTHPDISERLVKWTMELRENDIQYQLRTTIKAHALSDF